MGGAVLSLSTLFAQTCQSQNLHHPCPIFRVLNSMANRSDLSPTIINRGIAVQHSVLMSKTSVFIDEMGIFNLTFKQIFKLSFQQKLDT